VLTEIRSTGALPDDGAIRAAIEDFRADFLATTPAGRPGSDAEPAASDAEAPGEPESDKTLQTE
jgi:hypothetical protein